MLGSISSDIRRKFDERDTLWIIIIVCTAVFVTERTLMLIDIPLKTNFLSSLFRDYLSLPLHADFLKKPWTLFTYVLLHASVFHLLFNLLMLFWFGEIYRLYLGNKYFMKIFIGGGVAGGIVSILVFMLVPFFGANSTYLVGASAGVEAIIFAATAINPDHELRLILFGRVKLKYIAFASLILNYISILGSNSGGVIAHLGGALFGYFYMKQIQNGRDIFSIAGWFPAFQNPSKKIKVTHRSTEAPNQSRPKSDDAQKRVDEILDKINQSGYDSLSKEQKDFLFQYSNNS